METMNKPKTDNPFKVGDILHTSWGWGMTINTFYKVMKTTPKMVYIREMEKVVVENDAHTGGFSGKQIPTNDFSPSNDEVTRHKVQSSRYGNEPVRVKTPDGYARLWDGEPKYFNTLD